MTAPRASPDRLSDAIGIADAGLTVLDDRTDIEDHAIFGWLRAHELHRDPHHRLVVGDQALPEPWRARTLKFTSSESAAAYLRPLMHDAVAVRTLSSFGRGLSDFRAARSHGQLVQQVAAALMSGNLWAIEVKKSPPSRFAGQTSPTIFSSINHRLRTKIDFAYIANLEGNQWRRGYVPMRDGIVLGRSGMTVASGFDIGQWSLRQLNAFDFPPLLLDKVRPFVEHSFRGMSKMQVAAIVAKLGPVPELEKAEADLCDGVVFEAILTSSIDAWSRGRGQKVPDFRSLPGAWQTVWLSRNYQEGVNPKSPDAKSFRVAALAGLWQDALDRLNSYKDYVSRAKAEAELLTAALPVRATQ